MSKDRWTRGLNVMSDVLGGSIGESDLSENREVRQEFLVGIAGIYDTEGWTRRLFWGEDTPYQQMYVCVIKFAPAHVNHQSIMTEKICTESTSGITKILGSECL